MLLKFIVYFFGVMNVLAPVVEFKYEFNVFICYESVEITSNVAQNDQALRDKLWQIYTDCSCNKASIEKTDKVLIDHLRNIGFSQYRFPSGVFSRAFIESILDTAIVDIDGHFLNYSTDEIYYTEFNKCENCLERIRCCFKHCLCCCSKPLIYMISVIVCYLIGIFVVLPHFLDNLNNGSNVMNITNSS